MDTNISTLTNGCLPGMAHHWVVTSPRSQFSRSLARGDLVETTDQYCKNCEATRVNNVVIPPERVGNAHSELSEIYR